MTRTYTCIFIYVKNTKRKKIDIKRSLNKNLDKFLFRRKLKNNNILISDVF